MNICPICRKGRLILIKITPDKDKRYVYSCNACGEIVYSPVEFIEKHKKDGQP